MSHRARITTLLLPVALLTGCADDGGSGAASGAAGHHDSAAAGSATAETTASETTPSTSTLAATAAPSAAALAPPPCGTADAEMINVTAAPGEPAIRVPRLPGWEVTESEKEMTRLALINRSYGNGELAAAFIVSVTSTDEDVQSLINREMTTLATVVGTSDLNSESGEICGFRSISASYPAPAAPESGRAGEMTIIAVPHDAGTVGVALTSQVSGAPDPGYAQDVAAMVDGIEIVG